MIINESFVSSYNCSFKCTYYIVLAFQKMVDEEELQFHEDYMNEQDPSILHFLLASGDDVCIQLQSKC